MAQEAKTDNLVTLEQSRALLLKEIGTIEVKDKGSYDAAANWLIKLRDLIKKAEALRTADKEPYLRGGQAVDKAYAEALKPVKDAEQNLNRSIVTFKTAEIEAAKREQARLDKLAEKQFAKAEAKGTNVIPEPVSQVVAAPEKSTVTEAGTLGIRMIRRWRYANDRQQNLATSNIPSEFWTVDETKISKMVTAGVAEIAGIVIFEEASTTARASRA